LYDLTKRWEAHVARAVQGISLPSSKTISTVYCLTRFWIKHTGFATVHGVGLTAVSGVGYAMQPHTTT